VSTLEANKAVCKELFAHLSQGEFDQAIACLSDDVVWWVQGDWPGSGAHNGKDSMRNLLAALKAGIAGNIQFTPGHLTAEDDRVALEMTSSAVLKNGKHYNNTYHFLMTVKDGKICRVKEYLDTKRLIDTMAG